MCSVVNEHILIVMDCSAKLSKFIFGTENAQRVITRGPFSRKYAIAYIYISKHEFIYTKVNGSMDKTKNKFFSSFNFHLYSRVLYLYASMNLSQHPICVLSPSTIFSPRPCRVIPRILDEIVFPLCLFSLSSNSHFL